MLKPHIIGVLKSMLSGVSSEMFQRQPVKAPNVDFFIL